MTPPTLAPRRYACRELAVAVLLVSLFHGAASALTATKAEDVCPNDANPCVVSDEYDIAAGSSLDFGTRTVAIARTGRFSAKAGATLQCGRLEVTGPPRHRALIATGSQGAFTVKVLRRCSNQPDACFDDYDCTGGTCSVGDGSVDFHGALKATSELEMRVAGSLSLRGTVTVTGRRGSARLRIAHDASILGPVDGIDGLFLVDAREDILSAAPIRIGGLHVGGAIRLWAGRDLTVTSDITSNSTSGFNGSIGLDAGRDLDVGGAGPVRLEVTSTPTTDTDLNAGSIDLFSDRDLRVSANTSIVSHSDNSDIVVQARRNLTFSGSIESTADGSEDGQGEVLLRGWKVIDVEASARIGISGLKGGSFGALRVLSESTIVFDGTVTAIGVGGADVGFEACLIRLGPTASIVNAMDQSNTTFLVRSAFFVLAGAEVWTQDGANYIGVRSYDNPFSVLGTFVPAITPWLAGSLDPCLTCGAGDNIEVCDDSVDCTTDVCGESGCRALPDDSFCDDGLFCTGAEHCDAEAGCVEEAPVDCSFLDAGCTIGVCNESLESCVAEPLECDDGKFCNGVSVCDGNGGCIPGTPPDCSYLDAGCLKGYCDPVYGSCRVYEADEASCDDGDPCTTGDVCILDKCRGVRDVACGDCGNSTVQWGEQCDDGDRDFERGDICGPDCRFMRCGHPLGNPDASALDALFALRASVELENCDLLMCSVDHRGGITANDALLILREAVGLDAFLCITDVLP